MFLDIVSPSVFFFENMVQMEKLFFESLFFRLKSRMESVRESQLSEALSILIEGVSEFTFFTEFRDRNDGGVDGALSIALSSITIDLRDAVFATKVTC